RQPQPGARADGRGGREARRERDHRHALRHVRDGQQLDRDLRVRDGGEGQQGVTKAVVFDLFETLVDYDEEKSRAFSAAAADLLGREPQAVHVLWREGRRARDSGPMLPYLESIGITGGDAERLLQLRRANSAELL